MQRKLPQEARVTAQNGAHEEPDLCTSTSCTAHLPTIWDTHCVFQLQHISALAQ
jgi:hypothetical protein